MLRILPLALAAALVLPASASAATVSGKVGGGRGYTVIALAANGQSAKAKLGARGRFSLKLPGKRATLQLVKPNGTYFGPVFLRGSGRRAFVGLKGGKLGRISLKRGYAVAKAGVSTGAAIRTKKGAPLGAGNLGFVKTTAHARNAQPGGDPDGDGVPNTFDADDNGNKTLDAVDPLTASTVTLFSDVQASKTSLSFFADGALHPLEGTNLRDGAVYLLTVPTALGFHFTSVPALAGYDSTAGSDGDPLLMTSDSITLRFRRPQRAGLGSEPARMDMGHLRYAIPIAIDNRQLECGAERFSGLSPTLSATADLRFPLRDSAADAAPNAKKVLQVTFDLGGCLRANGIDPAGEQVRLPLQAVTESRPGGTDRAVQTIAVCLPGCVPPPTGGAKPDLVVDSALGSELGGNCEISVQVGNRGTAQSFPTETRFAMAGSADVVVPTQAIAAGGTQTVGATIGGTCFGRAFTVTADSANTVDELFETNNVASGVF